MTRLWRDRAGSVLVEYTIVFPLFILVILGTVDAAYMFFDWAKANKAAFVGARYAVTADPVALNITSPPYTATQLLQMGNTCFNSSGNSNGNCPSMSSVCTGAATGGSCTNNYGFNDTSPTFAFTNILTRMQAVFCSGQQPPYTNCPLQRQNVMISYATTGVGFVGEPNGFPMTVTVSVQCVTHRFFFIGSLMRWAFAPQTGCPGPVYGWAVPNFATTLTSEDLATN